MTALTRTDASKLFQEQGRDIVIPDNFTSIESGAFAFKNLTSVVISDSITIIPGGAFSNNQLTSVVIPDGVTEIRDDAFGSNQLTSVVIPDSVTKIGQSAFSNNQLTRVVIGDSVTEIGQSAFARNPLKEISIPDQVKSIQLNTFRDTLIERAFVPVERENFKFLFDVNADIILRNPGTIESSESVKLRNKKNNIVLVGELSINGIGNSLANIIEGNDAKNKFKGKDGNDILIGNGGRDIMAGGNGNDTFIYRSLSDSGVTRKTRDVITDFSEGDAIDLRDIDAHPVVRGDQAFVFIGSDSFSRPGQVNFVNGLLSVNTDSDPAAELQIMLKNVTELFDGSLIL